MKKVVCNALFEASMPIMYKELGHYVHKLGLFEEEKDAIVASNVLARVLVRQPEMIKWVNDYTINPVYVPETQMVEYYETLEDFLVRDCHTVHYAEQKGADALQKIVDETQKDVDSLSSKQQTEGSVFGG